jgi:hypothetical protein
MKDCKWARAKGARFAISGYFFRLSAFPRISASLNSVSFYGVENTQVFVPIHAQYICLADVPFVIIDFEPVTPGFGEHCDGSDPERSGDDCAFINAVVPGVFVRELIDFPVRDDCPSTFDGLNLHLVVLVAECEHGFDLFPLCVGYSDA